LENAVPVAGFVTRLENIGAEYRQEECTVANSTMVPALVEQLIEIIKMEVPA
jgi:hypothetical protein